MIRNEPIAGQVALGGVAVQAQRAERGRRDEEHPRDRGAGVDQEDRRQRGAEQRPHRRRTAPARCRPRGLLMPKLRKNTSASGASIRTHMIRVRCTGTGSSVAMRPIIAPPVAVWNCRRPSWKASRPRCRSAATRSRVVVDTDMCGAARIECDLREPRNCHEWPRHSDRTSDRAESFQ